MVAKLPESFPPGGNMDLIWYQWVLVFAVVWDVVLRIVLAIPFIARLEARCAAKYKSQFRGYMLSMIHAICASVFGAVMHYRMMTQESEYCFYWCEGDMLVIVQYANCAFMGYLVADFIRTSLAQTIAVDYVIHHAIFMLNCILWQHYGYGCGGFFMALLGEISTVCLDIRYLLIADGKGDTTCMRQMNIAFAVSFFITRVVLFTYMEYLYVTGMVLPFWTEEGYTFHVFHGIIGLLFMAMLLNWFWFIKIVKMAFKPRKEHNKAI